MFSTEDLEQAVPGRVTTCRSRTRGRSSTCTTTLRDVLEGDGNSVVAKISARWFENRNRTAPVPFFGNRPGFRSVGSSQHIGFPVAVLNAAVAEGLSEVSSVTKWVDVARCSGNVC